MLGQQFYHETIRKIVISFGTMFNDIQLVRKDNSGTIIQTMKVPLAYGPREKFLVRLREDADLTKQVAITLPRIGFEIKNLAYDSARKMSRVQRFKKVKGANTKQLDTQYMPVPYNLEFELYIMAKQSDDSLQIVEQILPYFQPDYALTINDMSDMGITRDVPIVLNSIGYEDSYDGDFTNRRALIYTLSFTTKFYLYGPVTSAKVTALDTGDVTTGTFVTGRIPSLDADKITSGTLGTSRISAASVTQHAATTGKAIAMAMVFG